LSEFEAWRSRQRGQVGPRARQVEDRRLASKHHGCRSMSSLLWQAGEPRARTPSEPRTWAHSHGHSSRAGAASAPTTSTRACSRTGGVPVGPVNEISANLIVAQLCSSSREPDKTLLLHQSPVDRCRRLAIYDTMQFVKPDVSTLCIGRRPAWAHCCWPRRQGQALRLPNSRDDPPADGRLSGQASDVEIHARNPVPAQRLNEIMRSTRGRASSASRATPT